MGARGRVLVVDDEQLVLQITRARLEGAGYEVITRDEAMGTTQDVIKHEPDVVLLDVRMPALSGDLLAKLLQETFGGKSVPVIFHSSEDLLSLQKMARETGAVGAIPKTGDDAMFIAQFERLFARATRKGNDDE